MNITVNDINREIFDDVTINSKSGHPDFVIVKTKDDVLVYIIENGAIEIRSYGGSFIEKHELDEILRIRDMITK